MKVLDLFSGIGGFSLGLERAGMETAAFCEIDSYCTKVLNKHWPSVPVFEDIKTLRGEQVGTIDIICGGYPCQPFSAAGKRLGKEDDRHLWPEYLRLIRELRPRWVVGENVAGHISMGIDSVLSDLEGEGYAWETFVIPACAVDAKHRRDRVWIVANAGSRRLSKQGERKVQLKGRAKAVGTSEAMANSIGAGSRRAQPRPDNWNTKTKSEDLSEINGQAYASNTRSSGETLADSDSERGHWSSAKYRAERWEVSEGNDANLFGTGRKWPTEPAVGRVANGIPSRVDRLKCLGNAVVPQIPEMIGRAIMVIESADLAAN